MIPASRQYPPLTGPHADRIRAEIERFMARSIQDALAILERGGVGGDEAFSRVLASFLGTVIGGIQCSVPGAAVEDLIAEVRRRRAQ